MWVNKEECEYCEYHVAFAARQAELAAAAANRSKKPKPSTTAAPQPPAVPLAANGARPFAAVPTRAISSSADARGPSMGAQPSAHQRGPYSEATVAQALEVLKGSGYTFQPPDPNSTQPFKHQFQRSLETAERSSGLRKSKLPTDVRSETQFGQSHPRCSAALGASSASSSRREENKGSRSSALLGAYGRIDAGSLEGQRVANAKPVAASSERDQARAILERSLHGLQKRDELSAKVRGACCFALDACC